MSFRNQKLEHKYIDGGSQDNGLRHHAYVQSVYSLKSNLSSFSSDESSHIGLPMDFSDECPPGFVTHVGKTTYSQGEISTVYCVLSVKGLRSTKKGRFRSFCMFLLNQNRETCPKGKKNSNYTAS
ncbi:hypothetical protein ACTXT7_009969 [Hymenolepis weldensis]